MGLENKTVIFLGSSVTVGPHNYSMADDAAEALSIKALKWAEWGTTLVDNDDTSYVARLSARIPKQKNCDLFICQLSTNDARLGSPLGEISDSFAKEAFDTKTVIGAIEFIIASVKEAYGCKIAFYTGTFYDSPGYAQMVDALLEIAQKWQIDVIDLWNDQEMRNISAKDYVLYMRDMVHPSRLGYNEWWGPKFRQFIKDSLM